MTIDGPWAGDPVKDDTPHVPRRELGSEEMRRHYLDVQTDHADDPQAGCCLHCHTTRCPDWRWATHELGLISVHPSG